MGRLVRWTHPFTVLHLGCQLTLIPLPHHPNESTPILQILPILSYPPCAVQIHQIFLGGGNQPTKLISLDLAPRYCRSKVMKDSQEAGTTGAALTIHLSCKQPQSLLDKLTLIIKLTAHIKVATSPPPQKGSWYFYGFSISHPVMDQNNSSVSDNRAVWPMQSRQTCCIVLSSWVYTCSY